MFKDVNLPTTAESYTVSIRWFVENCCQIKLANGKTILIDPCLPEEGEHMAKMGFGCGYTVDDIDACDYVLINHTHGDHVWSLGKVFKKFNPRVLVNADAAYYLAKVYDIDNPLRIFPLQYDHDYDFGDFRLHTYPAQHYDVISIRGKNQPRRTPPSVSCPEEAILNMMGSMFNMNFLITCPGNFRIGFDGGYYEKGLNDWRDAAPNLLMRHFDDAMYFGGDWDKAIDNMAETLIRSGAQYMLLNCVQAGYREDNGGLILEEYIPKLNARLEALGSHARVFNFAMGKWFKIMTNIMPDV